MQKAPIDDLFFQFYGHYPAKAGQGFQMLIAAAVKLLSGQEMSYDGIGETNAASTSTETNEKGGVTKITLNLVMHVAEYEEGDFSLIFTEESTVKIAQLEPEGLQITSEFEQFYDAQGNVSTTMDELRSLISVVSGDEDFVARGGWILTGEYLAYKNEHYGVRGITYEIPVRAIKYKIVIEDNGQARLFVQSESGHIDRQIKSVDLRGVAFKDGRVEVKNQG
ncbi:hypothetical protein [Pseudochryseolinea flava]|uniref:Uncharacterized protein n=1 Tax=Pseudochryseolinea flava TaxID=2059302 RepID=A0A364Y5J6_9BACT|nr:hypothetical protein [Pseudochryseolinea flava]RAW02075.1 hypothetical protein DQQ10_05860 [Pseudochryseolinea flava]